MGMAASSLFNFLEETTASGTVRKINAKAYYVSPKSPNLRLFSTSEGAGYDIAIKWYIIQTNMQE